jgi:hypothetical protein
MILTETDRKALKPYIKKIAEKNNTTDRNVRFVVSGETKLTSELSKNIYSDVIKVLDKLRKIDI